MMAHEIEHRLTKLETRLDYTETLMDDRHATVCSHTHRLTDVEGRLHNLAVIQSQNVDRLAKVEVISSQTSEDVRDARKRRQAQMALVQWVLFFAMGLGALVGVISDGTADVWNGLLGGLSRPL